MTLKHKLTNLLFIYFCIDNFIAGGLELQFHINLVQGRPTSGSRAICGSLLGFMWLLRK